MRFLAVGAHPDDIESNAAGVLSRFRKLGHDVAYLICTDGSKGSTDINDGPRLKEMRQQEQRSAGQVVGAESVMFLDFIDGELKAGLPLRREIVKAIRTFKPDVVMSWDPTSHWIGDFVLNHPDHMAVGRETTYAVYPSARDNLMFPELYHEGLPGFKTRELWLFGTNVPNLFCDVTQEFPIKIEALSKHASQVDADSLAASMARRNRWTCRDFSNPITHALRHSPQYVESFRRIALDPISDIVALANPAWQVSEEAL